MNQQYVYIFRNENIFLYRAMQAPHIAWNSQVTNAGINIYMHTLFVLYLYVPDEGSLLPKYRDCTTYNDFELCIYIYIY